MAQLENYVDTRCGGFVWIRPRFKLSGSQQQTYWVRIDTEILDEFNIDYEFTENRDLIINDDIDTVLDLCTHEKIYIE